MLMTYATWKKLTNAGMLSRRSKLLREVDKVLELYHDLGGGQSRAQAVSEALTTWKKSKKNWRKSVRNKRGALDVLTCQLSRHQPTKAERKAQHEVRVAAREHIGTLFLDKKIVLKSKFKAFKEHSGNAYDGRTVFKGGKEIGSQIEFPKPGNGVFTGEGGLFDGIKSWLKENVVDAATDFQEMVQEALGQSLTELLEAIVPYVGLGWSAYKSRKHGKLLKEMLGHEVQLIGAEEAFAEGDALAALEAVKTLLRRETGRNAVLLASYGTETAVKTAALLADGGTLSTTVAGTVAVAARLLLRLSALRAEYDEKKAGEEFLEEWMQPESEMFGDLFVTEEEKEERALHRRQIFEVFPLAGAYFVISADTSVLVNVLHDYLFHDPAFMTVVENLVRKHLQPVRDAALTCIREHRFRFTGEFPKLTVDAQSAFSKGQMIKGANTKLTNVKNKLGKGALTVGHSLLGKKQDISDRIRGQGSDEPPPSSFF